MLVQYFEKVADSKEVHERVILRHLVYGWYHILTPDGDVYAEQLTCPPAVKVWGPLTKRATGGRYWPRELRREEIYRFEDGGAELYPLTLKILKNAEKESKAIVDDDLLDLNPPAQQAHVGAGDDDDLRLLTGPGGAGLWAALIDIHGYKIGDGVILVEGSVAIGHFGVALLASGMSIPVEWLPEGQTPRAAASGGDLAERQLLGGDHDADKMDERLLPLEFDRRGKRHLDFKKASDMLLEPDQEELKEVVDGPTTICWVTAFMAQHGGSALAYHSRWQHEARLTIEDPAVLDHETLCHILQTALQVDQLNLGRLMCFELLARALQRIQGRYRERLIAGGTGNGKGKSRGALEEDYHMVMGTQATWGRVLICPALSDYLADKRQKKSALLKEERKLDEERRLAAKAGDGK